MLPFLNKIYGSVSVEFEAPANQVGSKDFFPDIPELRNNKCVGCISYSSTNVSTTPRGNAVINYDELPVPYVSLLNNQSFAFISVVPYVFFDALNYGTPIRMWEPTYVVMQQSYIEQAQQFYVGGISYLFDFFYIPSDL